MLQASMDKKFGDIAVEKGYLTDAQVQRLLGLQGNTYLTFLQAVVDLEFLTIEQLKNAEKEYQRANDFTESDMAALKTGDVEKAVPVFLSSDDPLYKGMFAMGIKNMYRLVDNHLFVGKSYTMKSIKDEVLGYQKFHGDQNATVAISGKYEDVRRMAIAYTKEEFIETREDALDAVCELINCINGLYATEQSKSDAKIELEPPNFSVSFAEANSEEMIVMPVYISGGEIKYIIAISRNIQIG
jgi:CheY-specific phosphatase CheX